MIGKVITIILLALLGGLPSLFMAVSLPGMIIWKIYRKCRFGYRLTD